ncbi:DUF6624 domain-containing protein [Streptomyces sp. A5-4]|uniref:DUF6624 domain-containing protein n=1 Tax=Streptomyces sp. A5-4 TaxID=3384771 RepID=UPI003DA99FF7
MPSIDDPAGERPPAIERNMATPEVIAALRESLRDMIAEERQQVSGAPHTLAITRGRNSVVLKEIVEAHGWPTGTLVGDRAALNALMILLHCLDLPFLHACCIRIVSAVAAGDCDPIHGAYIEDHCAVQEGRPQRWGTKIDPATLLPYLLEDPEPVVDQRRAGIGLPTVKQERTQHQAARGLRACLP